MKTTFFLSCFIVVGAFLFKNNNPVHNSSIVTYKVSKSKKTSAKPIGAVRIIIDKSDYELHVYDSEGWYATYRVVFGKDLWQNKKEEGAGITPEGGFK